MFRIPFLLNRDTPPQGYDLDEYINGKYGDGVASQAQARLDQAGRLVGVSFNRQRRIVNSVNSHRMMEFVHKTYGFLVGDKVMNNLFKLYFENAKDISNDDVLLESLYDIAEINDKETIEALLKTNEFQTEVLNADRSAKSSRINGVPHITFFQNDSKLGSLSGIIIIIIIIIIVVIIIIMCSSIGAQPPEVFEQLLLEYLENLE